MLAGTIRTLDNCTYELNHTLHTVIENGRNSIEHWENDYFSCNIKPDSLRIPRTWPKHDRCHGMKVEDLNMT